MNLDNLNLDEICAELDSLSIRMLQLMKEYMNVKLTIEDLMKTGCLHLAKARYIMGNRNVSALQLPSEDSNEISALTTVISKEKSDTDQLSLELSRLNLNDNNKNYDKGVRQRLKKDDENDIQNDNEEQNNSNNKTIIQDPLKWFGVLVPQDMRQAQMNFNKAIDYVVQCANIQLEMLNIEGKFKQYVEKKQQLTKQ